MKRITNQELIKAFAEFDAELDLDESKIASLPEKQKGELYLAIQKVLKYREDFPPDLAAAVQELAKQAAAKHPEQEGNLSLDIDSDGLVLESGEIILPSDPLFLLAKQLSEMGNKEVEQLVDDLVAVFANYGNIALVKLMGKQVKRLEKKVSQLEEERGITKGNKQTDKGNGAWPIMTSQM